MKCVLVKINCRVYGHIITEVNREIQNHIDCKICNKFLLVPSDETKFLIFPSHMLNISYQTIEQTERCTQDKVGLAALNDHLLVNATPW